MGTLAVETKPLHGVVPPADTRMRPQKIAASCYTSCLKKYLNASRPCCFSHSAYWLPERKNYSTRLASFNIMRTPADRGRIEEISLFRPFLARKTFQENFGFEGQKKTWEKKIVS